MSIIFQKISSLLQRVKSWVKLNQRIIRGWLELESSISYRFPVLESIIGILLVLTCIAVFTGDLGFWRLTLHPDSDGQLVAFSDDIGFIESSPLLTIPYFFGAILIFLIPLVVSYSTARGFENGTARLILSYPISRSHYLLLKTSLGIIVVGILSTLTVLFGSFIIGRLTQLSILLAIIIGIWVLIIFSVSISTFFAILLRNSIATFSLGIGILSLAQISYLQMTMNQSYVHIPYAIKGILNPLLLVNEHLIGLYHDTGLLPPSFEDVTISIILCIIISLIAFILTWKTFDYMEVK